MQFLLPWAGPLRDFLAWNIISSWIFCLLAFDHHSQSSDPTQTITASLASCISSLQTADLETFQPPRGHKPMIVGHMMAKLMMVGWMDDWFCFRLNTSINSFGTHSIKIQLLFCGNQQQADSKPRKNYLKLQSGNPQGTEEGLLQTSCETTITQQKRTEQQTQKRTDL